MTLGKTTLFAPTEQCFSRRISPRTGIRCGNGTVGPDLLDGTLAMIPCDRMVDVHADRLAAELAEQLGDEVRAGFRQ